MILVRALLQVLFAVMLVYIAATAYELRRDITWGQILNYAGAALAVGVLFATTFAIGNQPNTRFVRRFGATPEVLGASLILLGLFMLFGAWFVASGQTLELADGLDPRDLRDRRAYCFAQLIRATGAWWPSMMVTVLGLALGLRGVQLLARWKPRPTIRMLTVAGIFVPPLLIFIPMVLLC
ncbi:MAG TPA: hypothetical protein VF110_01985 [Burkholderiales bacterium]